ncbi:MAG: trimeric autotransporter adhesin [Actinomycetota bacterium]|jgi:hypothetical protein|nr:trimeric autotransporter adhesin [Actinomycetota bacterium]
MGGVSAPRAWPRLFCAFLGLAAGVAAVTAAWTPQAAAAATVDCRPGSGPPCQQAFFQIDKATGKVVAAVALPGDNNEGADYDGVDCQIGGSGRCFLAADHAGFLLMTFSSFTCDPTTATTPIGTAIPPTIDTIAFDKANSKLYAAVGSQLKVVDQSTGVLTDTSSWLGVATGPSGDEELAHVTALTFDPATGNLFGVESRGARPALLFKVDAGTGGVIHDAFGAGLDYVEIAPVGGRNDVYGIVVSGATMYATMSLNDADPHLATVNTASGATADIGSEGVPLVEGLTTDSTGNLYGLSGSGGTVIGTLPCPTPSPTPTVTPTVTPTTPAPSIAPVAVSVPPAEVLGLQTSRPPAVGKTLPTTGLNAMPLAALAAAFILVGLALARSRPARSRPDGSGDVEGEIDGRG